MAPSMRPFARMFHGVGRDRRWRTKGEYDILLGVKQCRVSFQDSEGVEHAVEVEARTLYEAGLVIDRFRRCEHVQYEPEGGFTNRHGASGARHPTPADQEDVRYMAPPAQRIASRYGAEKKTEGPAGRRGVSRRCQAGNRPMDN